MFKASIALVLVAFAALAYGWIADNDAILYASIAASAVSGLLLLRSTMVDRKAYDSGPAPRAPEPERVPPLSEPAPSRTPPAPEATQRLAWPPPEAPAREAEAPPAPRAPEPPPAPPAPAAEQAPSELYPPGNGDAAEDFRSRLAAVLGPSQPPSPPEPAAPEPAPPAPEPERAAPEHAPAHGRRPRPQARRGRKRAAEPVVAPEAGPEEPDWIHIDDVPRIARATQPGGGFSRPDMPEGRTTYRPQRPGVPADPEPARRRRRAPAEKTAGRKPPAPGGGRGGALPSVTRVSGEDPSGSRRRGRPRRG